MAAVTGLTAPTRTAAVLAFVASYVDTTGFIALFSLFTAHVTGNFVVIAAAFVGHDEGLTTKLLALPTFVTAVGLAQAITLGQAKRPRLTALVLVAAQIVLLIGFMGLGLAARPVLSPDAPLVMMAGLVGVFAMGLQNALGHTPLFRGLSATTVMTGNVTQATMDLVSLTLAPMADRAGARDRLGHTWPSILAFAVGAATAAAGFSLLSFWSLLVPILLLAVVAGLVGKGP